MKNSKTDFTPEPIKNRPKKPDFIRKLAVRTLSQTPPGGGETMTNKKTVLKYSW
jgi:hypothetical protein